MKKQRKYNWSEILKAFDESGLTQTRFCDEHNINPKYFSLKRSRLLGSGQSAFEKVDIQKVEQPSASLVIEVGRCKIHCPENMPLASFASLVHRLA